MTRRTVPTRQGWIVAFCAILTGVAGRLFGVIELYLLSAAMLVALVIAFFSVLLRRPRVNVRRWVRPEVLTAGDTGRVDLVVRASGHGVRPAFDLSESVGFERTARIAVAPLRGGTEHSAGYRVPTTRRGVLTIGPLIGTRSDILGLVTSTDRLAETDELLVAPRAYELRMPELGDGILGRHLLAQSVRLGPGDFHSLREYVPGDEPRTIHWRASARSDDLKVRQHSAEGLKRCTVVLDQQPSGTTRAADAFERAVVAAASIVHSADRAGLQTRFATTTGTDLRGPTVSTQTMHHLARVMPSSTAPRPVERDPGEGLGLVFVVSPHADSAVWAELGALRDPTLTIVGVFSEQLGTIRSRLYVDLTADGMLLSSWEALVGSRR